MSNNSCVAKEALDHMTDAMAYGFDELHNLKEKHSFNELHTLKEKHSFNESKSISFETWNSLESKDTLNTKVTPKFDRTEITHEKNNKLFKLFQLAEMGYVPYKGFSFAYDTVQLKHITKLSVNECQKLAEFNSSMDYSRFVQKVIANYVPFPERWETRVPKLADIRTNIKVLCKDPVEADLV